MTDFFAPADRLLPLLGLAPADEATPADDSEAAAPVDDVDDAPTVAVDPRLLRFLVELALEPYDIDGADPALADAAGTLLDWQRLGDGAEFFRRQGYFEGADPPPVMFDAAWYMDFYPDVRLLIAEGAFPDALSHYMQRGRAEWRAPNARSLARVARWRDLIRQVDPR